MSWLVHILNDAKRNEAMHRRTGRTRRSKGIQRLQVPRVSHNLDTVSATANLVMHDTGWAICRLLGIGEVHEPATLTSSTGSTVEQTQVSKVTASGKLNKSRNAETVIESNLHGQAERRLC